MEPFINKYERPFMALSDRVAWIVYDYMIAVFKDFEIEFPISEDDYKAYLRIVK